jgi:hypothetical protein
VGWIVVDAEPYGTVAVDGVEVGDTPIRREVTPGSHTISVSRDGFRPAGETVTVTTGNIVRRRYVLVAVP